MFGVTEVQRGLFPMAGSAVRLRRQIPYAIAAEMLLAGEDLPAKRAYELGQSFLDGEDQRTRAVITATTR